MSENFIDYKKLFEETVGVELPEIIDEATVISNNITQEMLHLLKYEYAKRQNSSWLNTIIDSYNEVQKSISKRTPKQLAKDMDVINAKLDSAYKTAVNDAYKYKDIVNVKNIPTTRPEEFSIENLTDKEFLLRKIGNNYIPNAYSSEEIKNYINSQKFKETFGVDFYDMKEKGYINNE